MEPSHQPIYENSTASLLEVTHDATALFEQYEPEAAAAAAEDACDPCCENLYAVPA